jgi:hypothetical protein
MEALRIEPGTPTKVQFEEPETMAELDFLVRGLWDGSGAAPR